MSKRDAPIALKTIVACLMIREPVEAVMASAVARARASNAHLDELHSPDALLAYPGIAMHLPHEAFRAFTESQKAEAVGAESFFSASMWL